MHRILKDPGGKETGTRQGQGSSGSARFDPPRVSATRATIQAEGQRRVLRLPGRESTRLCARMIPYREKGRGFERGCQDKNGLRGEMPGALVKEVSLQLRPR